MSRGIKFLVFTLGLTVTACSDDTDRHRLDGPRPDALDAGAPVDRGNLPDGYKFWPCAYPGQGCDPHDTCAINPICGPDKLCRPTSLQNCNDNLDCTEDNCSGKGLCTHTPKAGYCALPIRVPLNATCNDLKKLKWDAGVPTSTGVPDIGTGDASSSDASAKDASVAPDTGLPTQTITCCFAAGERRPDDPCAICSPSSTDGGTGDATSSSGSGGSSTEWSPANGGACNDGDNCTENDSCQDGVCQGTGYKSQCSDEYSCTDDLCDGKGGCLGNPLKSGYCLINGACYKDGMASPGGSCMVCKSKTNASDWTSQTSSCFIAGKCYNPGDKDSTSCSICDPTKSTTDWIPLTGLCKIAGACYTSGAIDSTGCGVCDLTKSATSWTPIAGPGLCSIAGSCYTSGTKDSTNCFECNPTASTTSWTPVSGVQSTSEDFETGSATGWTISNSSTTVGWQVSTKRPSTGTYSLYYGNPTAGNYDTSGAANNGSATMPTVTLTAAKSAGLKFMLWMDTETGMWADRLRVYVNGTQVWEKDSTQTITMKTWTEVNVNLNSYAGQAVSIKFDFDTVDWASNSTEGVYIDDVVVYHGC